METFDQQLILQQRMIYDDPTYETMVEKSIGHKPTPEEKAAFFYKNQCFTWEKLNDLRPMPQ